MPDTDEIFSEIRRDGESCLWSGAQASDRFLRNKIWNGFQAVAWSLFSLLLCAVGAIAISDDLGKTGSLTIKVAAYVGLILMALTVLYFIVKTAGRTIMEKRPLYFITDQRLIITVSDHSNKTILTGRTFFEMNVREKNGLRSIRLFTEQFQDQESVYSIEFEDIEDGEAAEELLLNQFMKKDPDT